MAKDKRVASESDVKGVRPDEFEFVSNDDYEMREFDAATSSAYGRELSKPLTFKAYYKAFRTLDAVKRAGKEPNASQIVGMMNAQQKATARAAFTTANLKAAGYKAPDANAPQMLLRSMIDTIVKARRWDNPTESQLAEARVAAEAATGIKWEELSDKLEPTVSDESEAEAAEETIEA